MIKNKAFGFLLLIIAFSLLLGWDFGRPKQQKKEPESSPIAAVKGPIVAKINNMELGLDDLNEEVDIYNAIIPAERTDVRISTREQKLAYLKDEVAHKFVLYQEALKRNLDKSQEVQNVLERQKRDVLVVELVRNETRGITVSDAEVEEYYNAFRDSLTEPEERWLREILVSTEQEAKDILVKLIQGADFITLAKQNSISASAAQGGDLGYLKASDKFPQFSAAAFSDALDVGQISNVFKGSSGYYIVKLEGKRGGQPQPLVKVAPDIKKLIHLIKQKKKIDELSDRLFKQSQVEFYEGEIR